MHRTSPSRHRPDKPDPQEVGYIVVMADAGLEPTGPIFMGWCPMNETAALVARVRTTHPRAVITDWFPSTRRIGHWHHKALIPSRVTPDNADWYTMTDAMAAYLTALRAQYADAAQREG
jgi:hypothetical protein